ncbi:MAG: polysaccharide pyruvyl transferase family protein [Betaproteobacteria bacterium]|nr:polysaccharide pyruvyl transferase family protein [Betaproteobacteria bacterium]
MSAATEGLVEGLRARPRRVVLAGNYGSGNLGDELLLRVIAGWVREAGGEASAISVDPAYTERAHGMRGVGYSDAAAMADAVAGADLLVLGGGGLLQDYDELDEDALERFPAFGATQFAQYALLATALDVPYVALAQGVGPLRGASARRIASHVFASAYAASLRDRESAALLRDVGCAARWPVAPDPGWAWRPADASPRTPSRVDESLRGRKVLAVLLRDWAFDAAWEDRFAAAFGPSLAGDWACLWIDFRRGAEHDPSISERMRARLPGVHASWRGDDLDEAYGVIAGCDAVLAMRMHGALLAHVAGRPAVAIEYDGKVAALADEAGVPDAQRVPLTAIGERLAPAISAATGAGAYCMAPARVAELAARSLEHRDVLWRAMAATAGAPDAAPRARWLATWARQAAAAPGLAAAAERRLHRELDQGRVVLDQIARAAAEIAEGREEAARLAQALAQALAERDAARGDAVRWQAAHEAIAGSRSYRYAEPARRVLAAWRAWRGSR